MNSYIKVTALALGLSTSAYASDDGAFYDVGLRGNMTSSSVSLGPSSDMYDEVCLSLDASLDLIDTCTTTAGLGCGTGVISILAAGHMFKSAPEAETSAGSVWYTALGCLYCGLGVISFASQASFFGKKGNVKTAGYSALEDECLA